MAELEDTARYAIKGDPEGTLRWLFPGLDAGFRVLKSFLDTNLVTWPGEPKRHCDTVARLRSASGQPDWAVVLEVEARGRQSILWRLLEYIARLMRKVRKGLTRGEDRCATGAVLVLTGKVRQRTVDMALPGTEAKLEFAPRIVCLEEMDARETLARIEAGTVSRSVLPWIPLMTGGGDAEVVAWWKRLAELEASEEKRREWAGLAMVFADRVECAEVWKKELEGWAVWKSKVIEEWREEARKEARKEGRKEGRIENHRETIIDFLKARFPGQVGDDIAQRINAESAEAKLKEWTTLAATAGSIDDVRSKVMP